MADNPNLTTPATSEALAEKTVFDVITTHSDPGAPSGAVEFNSFSDGNAVFAGAND